MYVSVYQPLVPRSIHMGLCVCLCTDKLKIINNHTNEGRKRRRASSGRQRENHLVLVIFQFWKANAILRYMRFRCCCCRRCCCWWCFVAFCSGHHYAAYIVFFFSSLFASLAFYWCCSIFVASPLPIESCTNTHICTHTLTRYK